MDTKDTFVEIGIEEATKTTAYGAEAAMKPGAILYERIRPFIVQFLGRSIIRPLMSPRKTRYV